MPVIVFFWSMTRITSYNVCYTKLLRNLTRDFKPFVLQKSLNDFYIEYELNVYTKQPGKMMQFYSDLHKQILEEFNKAGVEIMSPHYTAYRDGNAS